MIQIGHLKVRLETKDLGPELLGEYDDENAVIYIKPYLTAQIKRSTVVHECLHAISNMYGLELSENQVRVLESAVISLVDNNPDLFK
jgi:hypothetical protein